MLVLSRRIDEQVVIGDSCIVTIIGVRDGTVRLGFQAPAEVPIHRREIFDEILARDGRISPGGHLSRDRPDRPPVRVTPRDGTPGGPLGGPASVRHGVGNGGAGGGPRTAGDREQVVERDRERGAWGYPEGLRGAIDDRDN